MLQAPALPTIKPWERECHRTDMRLQDGIEPYLDLLG